MSKIFWHQELYGLLFLSEHNDTEKTVLDCGAGGPRPPLTIFKEHGFTTYGIELSDKSMQSARNFEKEHNLDLNIIKGDMRELPFEDNSFGVVYTYNTVFHMVKTEINIAIKEMVRVLKPGGLMYVNIMSTKSDGMDEGEDIGNNEIKQEERGEIVIHSYHDENELDPFLESLNVEVYRKTIRSTKIPYNNTLFNSAYIDYILKKV
ncbi:class I SAM-dependent methyltransferase [Candidatus Izimaplasma bacterium]|nr:class I SAM-dependent methyltransferase [Candidatus Izimaplasma bacterium]